MGSFFKIINIILTVIPLLSSLYTQIRKKWEKSHLEKEQKKLEEEIENKDIDALNERLGFKTLETPKKGE